MTSRENWSINFPHWMIAAVLALPMVVPFLTQLQRRRRGFEPIMYLPQRTAR